MQAFWDAEPKNDDTSGSCIWCLGKQYSSQPFFNGKKDFITDREEPTLSNKVDSRKDENRVTSDLDATTGDAQRMSETEWPPDFLDDCESRIWFTYRSNFPAIKKSSDASMTLSVRLRSLGDQNGFTSDTGWGCMIRSGQSLLANALAILRLGRGVWTTFSEKY